MNRRGQTLILFVLLLPILLLLMAFTIDTGVVLKEHIRLNSTTKSILKTTFSRHLEEDIERKITDLMEKNSIPIENLKVIKTSESVGIQNEYEIESIFGKIVGIKEYKIKLSLKAKLENGRVKIEKE